MAKKSAKKAQTERRPEVGPLAEEIELFSRGDYARVAPLLRAKLNDPALSEGAKDQARRLLDATRPERGALLAGLAGVALLTLVIIVTALLQP